MGRKRNTVGYKRRGVEYGWLAGDWPLLWVTRTNGEARWSEREHAADGSGEICTKLCFSGLNLTRRLFYNPLASSELKYFTTEHNSSLPLSSYHRHDTVEL